MLSAHAKVRICAWSAVILSAAVGWGVGRALGLPVLPEYSGSLLTQGGLPGAIVVMLVGAATGGTLLARVHYEAALLGGAIALGMVSLYSGTMQSILFDTPAIWVFLWLIVEVLLLFGVMGGIWQLCERLRERQLLDESLDRLPTRDEPFDQRLLATACHIAVMALAMRFLCATQAKTQVLGAVGLSAYLGSIAAHQFVSTKRAVWYWASPLVVAILGYSTAAFAPESIATGDVGGIFAALARPTPMDYASAGVIGSLAGHWSARRWKLAEHDKKHADDLPGPLPGQV